MKKLHFSIAAAGILALAVTASCNKKDNVTPTATTAAQMPTQGGKYSTTANQTKNPRKNYTETGYYSKDHWDGCYGEAIECAQSGPIVIHPPKFFSSMTTAINGSPTVVASVFNDQDIADFCAQFMDPSMLTMLQSGNYYVSLGYDGPTAVSYRVGLTTPVTITNKEFAFQVNK